MLNRRGHVAPTRIAEPSLSADQACTIRLLGRIFCGGKGLRRQSRPPPAQRVDRAVARGRGVVADLPGRYFSQIDSVVKLVVFEG